MSALTYSLTRDGIVAALKPSLLPQSHPELLSDVLRMKRNRGDADADQFKAVACREFAVKLNASVGGARNAMEQWLRKGVLKPTSDRLAFMADLDAVLSGDRRGWTAEAA
jgi:hypothetical protein